MIQTATWILTYAYKYIYIYTLCHSTWHIFWHPIWQVFWHTNQGINYLTFCVAFDLAVYPTHILTFYLTWSDVLPGSPFYLASYLTVYLAIYLARHLAPYLAFYLASIGSLPPHSIWQVIRHSILHFIWRSIWRIFLYTIWHIVWHSTWQISSHSVWYPKRYPKKHIFWHLPGIQSDILSGILPGIKVRQGRASPDPVTLP